MGNASGAGAGGVGGGSSDNGSSVYGTNELSSKEKESLMGNFSSKCLLFFLILLMNGSIV